jgi:SAM-dependent methyltransferase
MVTMEVGCGLGWHAAMTAAATDAQVIGVEYRFGPGGVHSRGNATTFRRLVNWAPQLGQVIEFTAWDQMILNPRIQFVQATAHALPVADSTVDFLYTYNCLEHIPNLQTFFREAARVLLRPKGLLFASAQPLYYSPFGHHLESLFPLPWGHLLWDAETFANIMLEEAGRLGPIPLGHDHTPMSVQEIMDLLQHEVNHARPDHLRSALLPGPWALQGWVDLVHPDTMQMITQLGIRKAIPGVPLEALCTTGFHIRLQRCKKPHGWRFPLRLPVTLRSALRRWIPKIRRTNL